MKRAAFVACLAVLITNPGLAQSDPALDPALKRAAEARRAAQLAGNAEEWGKYTTDDFLLTTAAGVVKTKQQRMMEIGSHPPLTTSDPPATDDKWRVYGSTAIRTSLVIDNGLPRRSTTVWVKQPGGWKVAAGQLTPIAQPH